MTFFFPEYKNNTCSLEKLSATQKNQEEGNTSPLSRYAQSNRLFSMRSQTHSCSFKHTRLCLTSGMQSRTGSLKCGSEAFYTLDADFGTDLAPNWSPAS